MIFMYLMMAVLAVPMGIYAYLFIRRSCRTFGVPADKKAVKYVIGLSAVCIAALCCSIFSIGAIIMLHIIGVSLVMRLVSLIVRILAKGRERVLHIWNIIYGTGIVPIAAAAVIMIFGYCNMMNIVETDCTVNTEKNIRPEGYRAVLIADVHAGVSVDMDTLQKKCDEISEKDVDIVVLCGDIVDENTTNGEMHEVFKALSSIKSEYGTFFVYGNHDRQLYREDKSYTEEELRNAIEGSGITILQDEAYEVNDELTIIGREDALYDNGSRKEISELMENADMSHYIIVLDHQPKEYALNGSAGTDLILSGHTHGGQIWPADILFDIAKFDDAVYGYTRIDEDTQAFVTSGLAGWGYPVKTSSPAEYAVISILPD